MASMIAGAAAKKGSETAAKALTGDIYTRKWATVRGKGKKKTEVTHELRVNPLSVILAAGAAGMTMLAAGTALWVSQLKFGKDVGKDLRVDYIITLKDGIVTRRTYYLGSVPIKTVVGEAMVPWTDVLPKYYVTRGYEFADATQTYDSLTEIRGYATYKTVQERFGIQSREGFKVEVF